MWSGRVRYRPDIYGKMFLPATLIRLSNWHARITNWLESGKMGLQAIRLIFLMRHFCRSGAASWSRLAVCKRILVIFSASVVTEKGLAMNCMSSLSKPCVDMAS